MTQIGKSRRNAPGGEFRKFGFGFCRIPHEERRHNLVAVDDVLSLTNGNVKEGSETRIIASVDRVKVLFEKVALGDTVDWYTVSTHLAHPSPSLSRRLAEDLAFLAGAMRRRDVEGISAALESIREEPVAEFLSHFLRVVGRGERPFEERGWFYVLWSSSEPDLLYVNATHRTIEAEKARVEREYSGNDHPYGVLAAWLVHDPDEARRQFVRVHDGSSIGDDFYRLRLGDVKDFVEGDLAGMELVASSPWDGEDYEAEAAAPDRVHAPAM